MLNPSIHEKQFDPIAFEIEREKIFNQTEKDLSSQKYHKYSADFSDGAWDAINANEPEDYQLFSADYCNGYLSGTKEKLENRLIELQQSAA